MCIIINIFDNFKGVAELLILPWNAGLNNELHIFSIKASQIKEQNRSKNT